MCPALVNVFIVFFDFDFLNELLDGGWEFVFLCWF